MKLKKCRFVKTNNMKKHIYFLVGAIFMFIFSCTSNKLQKISFKGNALGTYYTIHFYTNETNSEYLKNIQFSIDSLLTSFNSIASIYVEESMISKINNNSDYEVNEMFTDIFNTAMYISEITDGAFDISVFPLVEAWGFGKSERNDLTQKQIDSLLSFVGYKNVLISDGKIVKTDSRISLNMNAIAKGYAVDLVSLYLESMSIYSYLVEIGGEVRVGRAKPDKSLWSIAIEKPAKEAIDAQEGGKIIFLENASVATSGTYRQYFETDSLRYSHTIDPKSGYPVNNDLLSVTVISDNCMLADALATACMVLGTEKGLKLCETLENTEAYFISKNKKGGLIIQSTSKFNIYNK